MGRTLSERFRRQNFAEEAFPNLAMEALEEAQPHRHVGVQSVLDYLSSAGQLPRQGAPDFGEPPVNLYFDDHIFIGALFWVDGTTSIHEHAFSGAFTVLEGSSVHVRYSFEQTRAWNQHLRLGQLRVEDTELLMPGDVRPILFGPSLIHALFHLQRPTLSLVVRTQGLALGAFQYTYSRSGLAHNRFLQPPSQARKLLVLRAAIKSRHPGALGFAERLIDSSDALFATRVLLEVNLDTGAMKHVGPLLRRVREHHGDLADVLERALAYERSTGYLVALREKVHDEDLRFFLALLLNVRDRDTVLRMMAKRFPDEAPVDRVLRCLDKLAAPAKGAQQGVLGIELDGARRWVLRGLLEGRTEAQLIEQAANDPTAPKAAAIQELTFILPFNSVVGSLLSRA